MMFSKKQNPNQKRNNFSNNMNFKNINVVSLHKETLNLDLTQEERNTAYRELKKRERIKPFTDSDLQQINSNIIKYKQDNLHLKKPSTKTVSIPPIESSVVQSSKQD